MSVLRAAQRGVRYIDGEFQMRCDHCRVSRQGPSYWPLTVEYWDTKRGLSRCRACWVLHHRTRQRERDRANADAVRRKNEAYRQRNRLRINAERRAQYAEQRRALQRQEVAA